MRTLNVVILAFFIIILNGLIGHFFAPLGIDLTPVVLIISSLLIGLTKNNITSIWKSILIFSMVSLNDILIKLYAGGSHDYEGLIWIHTFEIIGLIPSFGVLLFAVLKTKGEAIMEKITAIALFMILIVIHFQLFSQLGIGRHY